MKKLTKPGREKIVREMINVFKKYNVLDNISIIYNNKMVSYGSAEVNWDKLKYNDDIEYIYTEPEIKENKRPEDYNGNKNTLVVMYDGGALYSCMSGEFGWEWKDKLEQDLELIFGPYYLSIETIDNVSFTLAEGFKPVYEQIMDKLC